ncbi:MAG: HAD hydrolase-like protein [Candidatus Aenigmarchaeota archaeon]|nr:HAD hydrolase-like protein [Candidatus Aenigmarchaeota archaeon]
MINGIIFDFNRTIYDPETDVLTDGAIDLLEELHNSGYKMCLLSKRTHPKRREEISLLGLDRYFLDVLVIEGEKKKNILSIVLDVWIFSLKTWLLLEIG